MKRVMVFLIVASFLFAMGAVLADNNTNETNDSVTNMSTDTSIEDICVKKGGTWTTFNNGCADSCAYERQDPEDPLMCTQAITDSCDCGQDKCWNGKFCENNERQIKPSPTQIRENVQERKAIQVQHVIQAKNRLEYRIQQANGTCPDNCVCTGAGMKCTFANGSREMIIRAGSSGNTIVQVKNVNMSTMVQLFKSEDGQVFGVFRGNQTKKIILPDQASEVARQKLQERIKENQRNRKRINFTDENITLNEDGYYEIQGKKRARLFWIIPVKEKMHTQVDAETGSIIKQRYSWWGFLARDVREDVSEEETSE